MQLWEVSSLGIQKRPLLGWGFNRFGAAYPEVQYRKSLLIVIRLGDFDFDFQTKNGLLLEALQFHA
ncbi:hypothetical protein NIES4075_16980 [Tolypothrix sp. NIES-4075]|nr:hypothetical protein NIES4075_16980 [Tolypothrix sp. NIES-4075]